MAIREKATGRFIGWCGVGVLDFLAPEKELYYLIGRDYGLDRLYAKAHPDNKASVRIIERLGFSFERVLEGLTGDDEECNGEWLYVLTKLNKKTGACSVNDFPDLGSPVMDPSGASYSSKPTRLFRKAFVKIFLYVL
ncbi:GNAT family N-acetyltransferase [Brevibacillus brevis]|uniref:GNAT family N-acetyltransferase n=1 Tax=Brevibacillus brevis TaxID=1393 RepID=UPI0020A5BC86|nr:GNAT family N-acetyltransferase [Brevibacillus brevis]WGV57577.1 GNAT family N-acetyltransferase [Brevibacillus brevis]